jgi:hypothetical protein
MPRNDRSPSRRSAIIQLAAMAASGVVPARSATNPAKRRPLDLAKFAGAFVEWGPKGREITLQAWEKWLNLSPSSVVGVDFYAQSTWQDFYTLSWVPSIWKTLNPARNVVWSVPLTARGTALKEVASGLHDAEFDAAAKAISAAQPKAIIRIGWEMNVQSMAWFAKDQEDDYIEAFRRVVDLFRRHSAGFKYDWCPGWGVQDSLADRAYPGDDVVDYVGLDVYDFRFEGSAAERWDNFYLKAPFGLHWHKEFAARHGRLMSYPEWGVGNFGDNAFFIQQMYDWLVENEGNIAYTAYFDVDGAWPTKIDNGRFPESQRIFRELFGHTS